MKARIKTIVLSALGTIAAFTSLTYTSCEPDKCKAITCAYGGVCKEGSCICPAGYEGNQCETITRDRYKGTWTVFEEGTNSMPAQYDVTIDYGPTMTDMVINNFYNKLRSPINVRVKSDTLYIPQQTVDGYEVRGIAYLGKSLYYGEDGQMQVYYVVKGPDGIVNDFGMNSKNSKVSIWNH